MRVLDIDPDFFVQGVAHFRWREKGRLDGKEFPPWSLDDVLRFLLDQCGLETGDGGFSKVPGVAIEYHADLFVVWREAIQRGRLELPLSVTHLDAHADLGMGDPGYAYLMTELIFLPVDERAHHEALGDHIHDGNFLAFAAACR